MTVWKRSRLELFKICQQISSLVRLKGIITVKNTPPCFSHSCHSYLERVEDIFNSLPLWKLPSVNWINVRLRRTCQLRYGSGKERLRVELIAGLFQVTECYVGRLDLGNSTLCLLQHKGHAAIKTDSESLHLNTRRCLAVLSLAAACVLTEVSNTGSP